MHRCPAAAFILMICGLFAFTGELRADHCVDESARPAVCAVEFYGGLDGERLRRFDSSRPLTLPAGSTFDLEFEAYDQHDRRFPVERLVYGVDADDCRGLVEVDQTDIGRFRLRTKSVSRACHLWFWIPGNLNLEWRLEIAAEAYATGGYSHAQAEFISRCLYAGLLGREADLQGLRDTTAEIQRGNLSGRIDDIVSSSEFRGKAAGRTATALLLQLYQGILGREPDSSARTAFLGHLERGSITRVVQALLQSEEFRTRLLERAGPR
jgi:hypothetical protein